MRSTRKFFLLAAGLALALQASAANDKPIDVAFYKGGHFFTDGKGIDKDVIDELKKRGGYRFNESEQPRARIWKALEEGELAMSVSGLENPDRTKFAYFVPYIQQKNKALVLGNKYTSANSFVTDKAARMAVVRGFKHGEFFDGLVAKVGANGGVSEVPTIDNLFLMLQAGDRIHMIISQPAFYAKQLKDLGIESKVAIQDWDTDGKGFSLGLILSKKHFSEADAAKMKSIVASMKKDGSLAAIFSKYFSAQDVKDALNFD